jgi:hypothetical protein
MKPITIDHRRALENKAYFRRVAAQLCNGDGPIAAVLFLHGSDNSCCSRESYLVTVTRLCEAAPSQPPPVQIDRGDWHRA